jgi:2-polyprenyl-6-methoxyphenol hydroxylase-like FAD-dependent oxidoreductase
LLLSKIKSWHPDFSKTIEAIIENDIHTVRARASNPLTIDWPRKVRNKTPESLDIGHPRVWLLGDAIHAILPSRGMGANQALHDCARALPTLLQLAEITAAQTVGDVAPKKQSQRLRAR